MPPAFSPGELYLHGHARMNLKVMTGVPSQSTTWMVPSLREALILPSITSLRHCQSCILSSMPRLNVMFDHFMLARELLDDRLALGVRGGVLDHLCSLVRPVHSSKYPAASAPPRLSVK